MGSEAAPALLPQNHESRGIVLALVEHFSLGGGPLPRQRAGLRRLHATASWAYLFRLIKLLSSPSYRYRGYSCGKVEEG
jgi:hypothetical protein